MLGQTESFNLFSYRDKIKKEVFKQNRKNTHFFKFMLLFVIINILLTLINIEKYFINADKIHNNILSKFRKNDQMNVALAVRPYNQISDYFISKNNLDNGYQIIKNGKIVFPKEDFSKNLGYRKIIYIGYTDMNDEKGEFYLNYVRNMLKDTYEFVFEKEKPDYLLFSYFGCNHNNSKYNDTIKIAIYEEDYIPSFNEEDYIFGLAHIFYLDRYFRKSSLVDFLQKYNLKNKDFKNARNAALNGPKREKFCAAVLNNEINLNHFREKFVKELSCYR